MATDGSRNDNASEDDEPVILTIDDVPKSHTSNINTVHEPAVIEKHCLDNVTMDTMAVSNNPDVVPSVAKQQHRALFPQGLSFNKCVYICILLM